MGYFNIGKVRECCEVHSVNLRHERAHESEIEDGVSHFRSFNYNHVILLMTYLESLSVNYSKLNWRYSDTIEPQAGSPVL